MLILKKLWNHQPVENLVVPDGSPSLCNAGSDDGTRQTVYILTVTVVSTTRTMMEQTRIHISSSIDLTIGASPFVGGLRGSAI